MTQIVWLTAYNLLLKPLEPLSTHWKLATLHVCRHIPNLLYLMSTCMKLGIPYVDMFETWYTLCRHIRNLVYLISTHSKRATLARDIPDLLYLMSTCQHSKTNIEGLSTLQLTILADLRCKHQSSINYPPFVT